MTKVIFRGHALHFVPSIKLTYGNVYNAKIIETIGYDKIYGIINDDGIYMEYYGYLFEDLSKFREQQIKSVLDD